ncbi:hypothetical protein D3C80_452000 [compost metagenome]
MRHHFCRIGRRRGHHIVVFGKAARGAVVEDHPVLAQHQAVPCPADRQLEEIVAIDTVQEFRRVGAENLDLAERRDIAKPGIAADILDLAVDAFPPAVLARAHKPGGAMPQAGLDESGPILFRPVMQGRCTNRSRMLAARCSCQSTERDRRVERPEGRGADLGRRDAAHAGNDTDRVDAPKLALIGRHAGSGIAFGMLDMDEPFPLGEPEIAHRHIVLEIDKGLVLGPRHIPDRREGRIIFAFHLGDVHLVGGKAEFACKRRGFTGAILQTGRNRISAGSGTSSNEG